MALANIFQPLIDIFGPVLVFFHSIIGGLWGWSIIALTVVVRALLLPLALKQIHSMKKLQRVAPQMKAIKAKYKDDKQRQQHELMKFYKENEINPFASSPPGGAGPGLHRPLLHAAHAAARGHLFGPPGGVSGRMMLLLQIGPTPSAHDVVRCYGAARRPLGGLPRRSNRRRATVIAGQGPSNCPAADSLGWQFRRITGPAYGRATAVQWETRGQVLLLAATRSVDMTTGKVATIEKYLEIPVFRGAGATGLEPATSGVTGRRWLCETPRLLEILHANGLEIR